MKILVFSDTHGDIKKAREAIKKNIDTDLIIHLGDYFRDAQKIRAEFPGIPVEYIYGNSDFMIDDTPAEKLLEFEGKRIFMTHGHKYSVKWNYQQLFDKAYELKADVLLFGHTHVAEIVKNGSGYILNPGSISDPRGDSIESYAVIEINDGKVELRLCCA
ncbi:MAG: metallophosphoesterase [Clostridiaceae bacterium]|nr:metallophosphoesterase [Clostridiaceae bacterium]